MKETKPHVVRYCPYKPLPYHRSVEKKSIHRTVHNYLQNQNNSCLQNESKTKSIGLQTKQQPLITHNSTELIAETLQAISGLYPANSNTRVHWELPGRVKAQLDHPLHNVTLVTTPPHQHDDISDIVEEVLDLWAAVNKSSRDHIGNIARRLESVNEE